MAERIVKKQQLAVYVGTDAEIKSAISSGEITENDLSIVTNSPDPVIDVKNSTNTSLVTDQVATIPNASTQNLGLVKINSNQGISAFSGGDLCTVSASDDEIKARTQTYKPIVPKKLDLAVKTSITDNKLTLTNAEKDSARSWLDAQKVMQYETMPVADSVADEMIQYIGETTSSYTKGYFYKSIAHASPYLHPIFETSPKAGTVVTISDENFHSFVEGILPNPNVVTHGHIGFYSATSYSITLYYNNTFKYIVNTISELESAGFTFTPPLVAQDGLDFTCGEFTYAWERISTQPVTVNNNAPDENGNITINYSDVGAQATLSGTGGQVVYTTDTAGTVEAQSLTDFSYVVTDTIEFDKCKTDAPHTALICNLVNNKVYEYVSNTWTEKAGVTPIQQVGAGRFSYNRITTKLFFCTGTELLHMSTANLDAGTSNT